MDPVEVNGAAIRAIRVALRIEIADLAKEIGVSRAHLANVELGHRGLSVKTLDKLEEALKVDRRALLGGPCPKINTNQPGGAA